MIWWNFYLPWVVWPSRFKAFPAITTTTTLWHASRGYPLPPPAPLTNAMIMFILTDLRLVQFLTRQR